MSTTVEESLNLKTFQSHTNPPNRAHPNPGRDRDDTQEDVQTDLFIVGNYVNSPVAGCALLPSSIEKGVKYIFHLFRGSTRAYERHFLFVNPPKKNQRPKTGTRAFSKR